MNVNEELIRYVEREILPRYDAFDRAHRRDHALTVIAASLRLARYYEVNPDMVYAVAAYHDTGLREGRERHHEASARIVRGDRNLRRWFTEAEVATIAEAAERIQAMGEGREAYPFDIDGAVVKVNSLAERETLGSTAKFPRWAAAYKYPPEQKPSRVVDIVVQVGRTGVLTPKAVVEPVRLAGPTGRWAPPSQAPPFTIRISSRKRTSASEILCWYRRRERSFRRLWRC